MGISLSHENKIIIKPYDDLDIIAGQGTVGKEIVEQLKIENIEPDIYLCCCGGGGLISGSSVVTSKLSSFHCENVTSSNLTFL